METWKFPNISVVGISSRIIFVSFSSTGGSGSVFGSEYQSIGLTNGPSGPISIRFSFFCLFSRQVPHVIQHTHFCSLKTSKWWAHFEIFNKTLIDADPTLTFSKLRNSPTSSKHQRRWFHNYNSLVLRFWNVIKITCT